MRYFKYILLACSLQVQPSYTSDLIKVVVIDTGVDRTNRTIAQVSCPAQDSMDATRPTLAASDGIGPDAPGHYNVPPDEIGHGTHVAGIIRALAGDSGYCIAYCKYFLSSNPGDINLSNTINCLEQAKSIGAQYVNFSSVGGGFNAREKQLLASLHAWFITAAGNDGVDIDKDVENYYPASYHLPNEVVIGSYDSTCNRTESSNYGKDLHYFLGEDVYSALPGSRGYLSGTSMATAVATGTFLRAALGLPLIGDCKAYGWFLKSFWTSH